MENKIVLFQPNPFSATRPYSNAPLALLGISKLLAKENYLIRIITPVTHKNFLKTLIEESKNSICLGITAMTG